MRSTAIDLVAGQEGISWPAAAALAPLERILTETDGPEGLRWLTGEVGMPHHINDVLQAIAQVRGLSLAEVTTMVAVNWQRLVGGDQWFKPWTHL